MNPIGINLWNWNSGLCDDCIGLPEKIASMGFTAIELPMTTPEVDPRLISGIRDSGLRVSMCAALGQGRDLSSFDPDVRNSTMDYLTACLKTGEKLGADVFCGPLYAGGGKRHWLNADDRKRELELAVSGIQALSGRAADCGISLSIEPINRYRTSVCNTVSQVLDLIDAIGAVNVGLHYDTYQACIEEKDMLGALEQALKTGRLTHFHACANNRGAPGQGILPWNTILDMLRQYSYKGHITMETFALGGLDSSWIQVHEEPDTLARAGLDYLRSYFARFDGKDD